MSEVLLSVIVPVYNAAATIEKCADSVLCQAPAASELILVDDGSADASPALCDRLAEKDARVRVFHRQNGGPSAARNAGLAAASGRYLQFIDADDWLLPGVYDAALPALEAGADVCFFGVRNVGGPPDPPLPDAELEGFGALRDRFEHFLVHTGQFASPCNKIYRASAVGGVRFDESLHINEDLLFNLEVFLRCGRVRFLPDLFYCCDHRVSGSISHSLHTDLLRAEQVTRDALRRFALHYGLDEAGADALAAARLRQVAIAQMSVLMGRRGALSLRGYHRAFRALLADRPVRAILARWLADDPHRLMALPYRLCVALRLSAPLSLWCWLRCSTTHTL